MTWAAAGGLEDLLLHGISTTGPEALLQGTVDG
jgi:hypothetical protein